jgi:hypothetical protein
VLRAWPAASLAASRPLSLHTVWCPGGTLGCELLLACWVLEAGGGGDPGNRESPLTLNAQYRRALVQTCPDKRVTNLQSPLLDIEAQSQGELSLWQLTSTEVGPWLEPQRLLPGVSTLGCLFLVLRWYLAGRELLGAAVQLWGILRSLVTTIFGCCACRCCVRRSRSQEATPAVSAWTRFAIQVELCEIQQDHDQAVRDAWSRWSAISREIRSAIKYNIFCPYTWRDWNVFNGRIRVHLWYRQKRARQDLRQR